MSTEAIQTGMSEVPVSASDAVLARAFKTGTRIPRSAGCRGADCELRLLESVTSSAIGPPMSSTASGLLAGDAGWLKFQHEMAQQAITAHRRHLLHAGFSLPAGPGA